MTEYWLCTLPSTVNLLSLIMPLWYSTPDIHLLMLSYLSDADIIAPSWEWCLLVFIPFWSEWLIIVFCCSDIVTLAILLLVTIVARRATVGDVSGRRCNLVCDIGDICFICCACYMIVSMTNLIVQMYDSICGMTRLVLQAALPSITLYSIYSRCGVRARLRRRYQGCSDALVLFVRSGVTVRYRRRRYHLRRRERYRLAMEACVLATSNDRAKATNVGVRCVGVRRRRLAAWRKGDKHWPCNHCYYPCVCYTVWLRNLLLLISYL